MFQIKNKTVPTSAFEGVSNTPDTQEARRDTAPQNPNPPRSRSSQFDRLPTAPRHRLSGENRPELLRSKSQATVTPGTKQRLVVVSNRLIDPKQPAAGGLAVALGEMMHDTEGLWFGWSGKTTDQPESAGVRTESFGRTTLAQIDISRKQHDGYYAGFSNSVLWPVFHEEVKWADLNPEHFKTYQEVNRMLASHLAPMLKESDVLWIHDYHLIPFAQELRALGCKQRMGFFNHIPLPSPDVIKKIPQHRQLMEALMSYDLVGMQSPTGVENLRLYAETEGVGQRLDSHDLSAFGKKASIQAFPIGIDVESLKALVPSSRSQTILDEVRNESSKRMLMVGVDRLDYSKGVPRRLKAYRELLETRPELQNKVTLIQIAAPTRQSVPAYARLSDKTKKLVSEINEQFGTDDWKPVMYFNQSVDRNSLPEIYRMSHVGVVTPVADGMNLVAKEYIAAQKSEDPGVLVLSTGAGAASQLGESLLVPPKDRATIAKAYARALTMPLDERQKRHEKLMTNVEIEDLRWWRENYLSELTSPKIAPNGHAENIAPESSSGTDGDRNNVALSQFDKAT